jgi:hypothetical protein
MSKTGMGERRMNEGEWKANKTDGPDHTQDPVPKSRFIL